MVVPKGQYIPSLLYVDDNADDLLLLEGAVARAHAAFRLITLSRLDQAIDYLSGQGKFEEKRIYPPPDLLLLDYHLGDPSALDLLRWLDRNNFKLPVVIFSGIPGSVFIQPAFEAGADAWVDKPLNPWRWNDITAAFQLCLASIPPRLDPLSTLGILNPRRLRVLLRADINQSRRLRQQRRELAQLSDESQAEPKEAKKKFPFRRRSNDAGSP